MGKKMKLTSRMESLAQVAFDLRGEAKARGVDLPVSHALALAEMLDGRDFVAEARRVAANLGISVGAAMSKLAADEPAFFGAHQEVQLLRAKPLLTTTPEERLHRAREVVRDEGIDIEAALRKNTG
ncbi:MAG TPA: hypothetical protein PK280_14055 [Planctomycetota bacterium]|nr:hypothetical protein [Planctomycetota bacterium]